MHGGFEARAHQTPNPGSRGVTGPSVTVVRLPDATGISALDAGIDRAAAWIESTQRVDGSWCYPLEADCTIPSEYILMMHFVDEIDVELQAKLAAHLRAKQAEHGGWPLFHDGELDISCTVKCYWALKLAGDAADAPHMMRARHAVLAAGGAARANVFTRIAMAFFGHVPWRAVPFVPVEIALFPRWFPFHLGSVSYWTRTVVVPLSILCSRKTRAKNPTGIRIDELFRIPASQERNWFPVRSLLNRALLIFERTASLIEGVIPRMLREPAYRRAEAWMAERLNGVDGLGGIFPAMVNAFEALLELGYAKDDPRVETCRAALRRLVVDEGTSAWCQPCLSPVWDTGLAALALQEVARSRGVAPGQSTRRALDWLATVQVTDGPGDWRADRPHVAPGGWPFQYANPHYPDLDDTSVVAWAMFEHDRTRYEQPVRLALDWLVGMQSANGGFAAFDADNTYYWLNEIPFADHGALLDPPTSDVSARVVTALAIVGQPEHRDVVRRCLDYLFDEQTKEGAWFGRWGTNYIYGTWSVLTALERVEDPRKATAVERAVAWLLSVQREDGGWGEANDTYFHAHRAGQGVKSTPFQTAWALLALMAAGVGDTAAMRRGVDHLLRTQEADGVWSSAEYNAPGFPRVFFLRYHGYQRYFPLWALARWRRIVAGPAR